MKDFILVATIFTSLAVPAYAEEVCREQAQAMGYIGATELLKACETAENKVLAQPEEQAEISKQAKGGPESTSVAKAQRFEKVN